MGGGAYAQGVVFEKLTFAEAVGKAAAENKMVFIDCYTEWCGPCKMMAAEVFPQKVMGDFMNPRFVSVVIDMEKGEGVELARRFEVTAYPTFLLLDGNGAEVSRIIGAGTPEDFLAKLETAIDPANAVATLKAAYEADRNLTTGMAYIAGLNGRTTEIVPVVAELWNILPDDEKYTRGFLRLVTGGEEGTLTPDHPLLPELLANKDKFEAVMGKGSLYNVVEGIYLNLWFAAMGERDVDMAALEKSAAIVASLDMPAADPNGHLAAVALLTARKDWDGMIACFNEKVAPIPFEFRKAQVEGGLIAAWINGTPEQKAAIDKYYESQLENAKKSGDQGAITHYTAMQAFFANGGKPVGM